MNRLKLLRETDPNYFPVSLVLPAAQGAGSLWLGDVHSLDDRNFLARQHVRTVLSCCRECDPAARIGSDAQDIHIVKILVRDSKDEDIETHFAQAYEAIDNGRMVGAVLVHCMAGVSRSTAFVVAYMMRKLTMPYDEAYAYVKEHRRKAKPNEGFVRQLRRYEVALGIGKKQKQNLSNNKLATEAHSEKHEAKQISDQRDVATQSNSKVEAGGKLDSPSDDCRRVQTNPYRKKKSKSCELEANPNSKQAKLERFRAEIAYFKTLALRGQIHLWHHV